jgi:PAS domain S-box-containing protein
MHTALTGFYDYRLVALSILLSLLAAYAALDLAGRVTSAHGTRRLVWLCAGAAAMGAGIWSMHYVGMEAFSLPVPVEYDWPIVLLSLLAAISASAVALVIVSRPTMGLLSTIVGSIFMGGGIAAMHYIGMEAMRLPAMCIYSPGLVTLSVFLSIAISYIALRMTFVSRNIPTSWSWRKAGNGLILGLAIPVTHYSGMAAVHFMPTPYIDGSLAHAVSVSSLGLISIAVVTSMMLVFVFLMSAMDRQFSRQAQLLADSQLQLQAIFDHMTEGVAVLDKGLNIFHMNRAAARLFDLPYQTGSRKKFHEYFDILSPGGELLPPEQWPSERVLLGESVLDYELNVRSKVSGKTVNVEFSAAPIGNLAGEPSQFLISIRDLAERKWTDETRTRLVAIVESSEDAIIGKDAQGIVKSWNTGAEKIFGYTSAEMIGHSIKILLPPDRLHEEDEILQRIKRGETVDHIESVRRRKDGKSIHVSLKISPIKDASGKIVGASKIARDITEKIQMERQLQHSQKMDALGQLTGGIAHDFNNLLGIILGNLDLLEDSSAGNETTLDQVQTAQRAAARGADLTRRLLSFARMETLKPSSVSLNSLTQNMITMAIRALGPEIKVTTQFDDSLPHVFVDTAGLESALLNLVLNARDAMPKGGSITISTRLANLDSTYAPVQAGDLKAGWYACASVADTGQGMSKETLDRVFEPFFTTKPRGKGTGLGLAMVYGFVKQSGGTVRIYSELDLGTTVSMYLPLVEAHSEQETAVAEAHSAAKLYGTVLVVDDEPDLLKIAVAYLTEMGCAALKAIDGAAALEIVQREKKIDLMVTDIIMPGGMNGVELAQRVHELSPEIKIIYTSGFAAEALAERRMSLVNGPLLRKPYQRAEFRAIVRSVLGGNGATLE